MAGFIIIAVLILAALSYCLVGKTNNKLVMNISTILAVIFFALAAFCVWATIDIVMGLGRTGEVAQTSAQANAIMQRPEVQFQIIAGLIFGTIAVGAGVICAVIGHAFVNIALEVKSKLRGNDRA